MVRSLSLLAMCVFVASCKEFTGEPMRQYLPIESQNAPILFAKRELFTCAMIAVERQSPSGIGTPPPRSSDWQSLPIEGKVDDTSIVYRILSSTEDCWSEDVALRTGVPSVWDIDTRRGYFSNSGSYLLIFDADSDMYVVING